MHDGLTGSISAECCELPEPHQQGKVRVKGGGQGRVLWISWMAHYGVHALGKQRRSPFSSCQLFVPIMVGLTSSPSQSAKSSPLPQGILIPINQREDEPPLSIPCIGCVAFIHSLLIQQMFECQTLGSLDNLLDLSECPRSHLYIGDHNPIAR